MAFKGIGIYILECGKSYDMHGRNIESLELPGAVKDFQKVIKLGFMGKKTQLFGLSSSPDLHVDPFFFNSDAPSFFSTFEEFLSVTSFLSYRVFYFMGHSFTSEGHIYLKLPQSSERFPQISCIPLNWLIDEFSSASTRSLIIIDGCRKLLDRPASPLSGPINCHPSVDIITACSEGQYSYEFSYGEVNGGIFSHFFMESILSFKNGESPFSLKDFFYQTKIDLEKCIENNYKGVVQTPQLISQNMECNLLFDFLKSE